MRVFKYTAAAKYGYSNRPLIEVWFEDYYSMPWFGGVTKITELKNKPSWFKEKLLNQEPEEIFEIGCSEIYLSGNILYRWAIRDHCLQAINTNSKHTEEFLNNLLETHPEEVKPIISYLKERKRRWTKS